MKFDASDGHKISNFERLALPHLDAAYSLARWLTRNDHDAEDVVQMAYLRAFTFFEGFQGEDARAWLMTIVRNTYYTSLRDSRHEKQHVVFDEAAHVTSGAELAELAELTELSALNTHGFGANPETQAMTRDVGRAVNLALEALPATFREVVVLKEFDDLSYKEIAEVTGTPVGTVMSRLARARKLLTGYLAKITHGN